MEKSLKVPGRGHYFDLHQFKKTDEKNETPETPVIRFVREIVHVTETRESLDKEINADFTEVKAISSNGHGD